MSAQEMTRQAWLQQLTHRFGDKPGAAALREVLTSEELRLDKTDEANLVVAMLEAVNIGDEGEWGEAATLAEKLAREWLADSVVSREEVRARTLHSIMLAFS